MSKISPLQAAALGLIPSPSTAKTVVPKPIAAKTVATKAKVAKPAIFKPVVAKPIVSKPVVAKPAVSKPAAKAVVKTAAKPKTKIALKKAPITTTSANKKHANKKNDSLKINQKNNHKKDDKKDDKKSRPEKVKMERDSFTMPKDEYAQLTLLKARLMAMGQPAKKSELLRAGIKLLAVMSDNTLKAALAKIPVIKTGRPNK